MKEKQIHKFTLPLWGSLLLAVLLAGCITLLALWCQPNALRTVLVIFRSQPLLIVLNAMPIGLLLLIAACLFRNVFFGETVTVSGLITGQDLVAQLRGVPADEILITESMLREGEDIFLDDMTLEQAQSALGIRITPVPDDGAELLYALRGTEETHG